MEYTSKLFFDFKDKIVKDNFEKLNVLLNKDFSADYKLHYYNDLINNFVISSNNATMIHSTKGILNILDSANEIRTIIYNNSLKTDKRPDLYREIAIDDAVVVSVEQLKYIDLTFKAMFDKLKDDPEKDVIIGVDRQALYYAYLIYLWTIKGTFESRNIQTYTDAIINYLALNNDFKDYRSDYIQSIVQKIIDVHKIRIDVNNSIDAANKDLFNLFDILNDDTILELINNNVKDGYKDGVINPYVSMSYDERNMIFNFEYCDTSNPIKTTVFGNTIRFGQSKYKAVFHSLVPDGVFLECKHNPFYGTTYDNKIIQVRDMFIEIRNTMNDYSKAFNSNCELLNKISLGSFLTCSDKYHFNINEFKGKLEKHVQVTELFLSEYNFMLEHLYYICKNLQYNVSKDYHKIRVV